MPKLGDVRDERTIFVPIADTKIEVTYDRSRHTPEFMRRLSEADDVDSLSTMLATLVLRWDLQDDDGNMIPLDVDSLRTVPTWILVEVADVMGEDGFSPKAKKNENSGGTSRPAD